ncbi:3-oxoacyl-[acyl-carrier-protein] synthase, KASII [hydrothermal vent metagenome]|uniref:Nodulation protein E n=1 Tax=hydrothermal vent metagenome TaxID=652676 RepID=A0A3B0WTL2_9ZZZZ
MEKHRVVITGLGAVSAFGLTKNIFWSEISKGKSAVKPLIFGDELKMKLGYTLENFSPEDYFESKELSLLDRFSQLAIIAAKEAIADSVMQAKPLNNIAVVMGSGSGGKHTDEEGYYKLYKQGNSHVHPFMIPKGMHSAVASNVSKYLNLNGPTFSVSSACASGSHAIIQGALMVQAGVVEQAIVGASDAPFAFGILKAWDALRVVSNDQCRPFSKDRNGMILGEGAGVLAIETLDSALARGANIYAEIAGYGMASDAAHITHPDVNGIKIAITRALNSANMMPMEVNYINAHGTGTVVNDRTESQAINSIFGEKFDQPLTSSTKAMHGHALGASSALEAIATILAMKHNLVPPTINYNEHDDNCDLNIVIGKGQVQTIEKAMSNSFAFGGLNSSIVFKLLIEH